LEVLMVDGRALGALRGAWKERNQHVTVDSFLSDMFPASIRDVTFWRLDGVEMRDAMVRFAQVVALGNSYPNLKSVVLAPGEGLKQERRGWQNAGEWEVVKEELEALFGKGGVRFDLRWDRPDWTAGHL